MTAPRLLTITYAGLALPASGYQITGVHTLDKSYDRFALEFDVVAQASTEAALKTLTDALEAAYRNPDQDLSVTVNSQSFVSGSHSSNTLMSSRARCRLLPTFRSAFSRCYRCTVEAILPADRTGRNGRQGSTVRVSTDKAGIKSLAVSAVYTALSTNSASAQGTASFATYTASLKTALGGTWQTTEGVEYEHDDQDKVATFSAAYRQQIRDEGTSADETSFEVLTYRVTDERPQSDGGADVRAPYQLAVEFSVAVKSSVTVDLRDVYRTTIRAYIKSLAAVGMTEASTPEVISDEVNYNFWDNTVSGVLRLTALPSAVLRVEKLTSEEAFLGIALLPVFGENKHERVRHDGPADRRRFVQIAVLELEGSNRVDEIEEAALAEAEGAGFILVRRGRGRTDKKIEGPLNGDAVYHLVERTRVLEFQYAVLSSGGGGGSGRGGGEGATGGATRGGRGYDLGTPL